jgi:hypothetical protein
MRLCAGEQPVGRPLPSLEAPDVSPEPSNCLPLSGVAKPAWKGLGRSTPGSDQSMERLHRLSPQAARETDPKASEERAGEEQAAPVRRRGGLGWRARNASAATAGALGSGVIGIARLVLVTAGLIALLIGLAIVLRDVDANARNTIVKGLHEGANFFAGAFTGLITFNGHPKREITVDWGIALGAYLIVGACIAGAISRVGQGGVRFEQTHRAAS